jgi:CubicO group peptidase (beta-lactamase class C family)
MRHLVIFASLLVCLLIGGRVFSQTAADGQALKFDKKLEQLVQQDHFCGAVLIAQKGKVRFQKGYGLANLEWAIPNTPQTKFRIFSLTKQFTAAAILLLQEQGKLSVSDLVSRYVSDLPVEWRKLTLHQLLTHTSGLPDYTQSPEIESFNLTGASPRQLIALVEAKPLQFTPGSKMVYCNTGYILLGMVIEKVSGQSYSAFLKARIFAPLQMNNSGYDDADAVIPQRASGYQIKDGRLLNAKYLDMSVPYSAGALYSTVNDLFKWNEALASGGLLSQASQQQMFIVYPEASGYGAHYGYGIVISEKLGQLLYYHGGGGNGFASAIQRYPKAELCIIVLSNLESVKSWDIATEMAALWLKATTQERHQAAPRKHRL